MVTNLSLTGCNLCFSTINNQECSDCQGFRKSARSAIMAGEYGFVHYKRQFNWVSSDNSYLSIQQEPDLPLFTAAPRCLAELRSHWASEAAQTQKVLRFSCVHETSTGAKHEWSLDSEDAFINALMLVNAGEKVILTVDTASDTTSSESSGSFLPSGSGMDKKPPEWFLCYMKKFRAELMEEIGQVIDEKLSHKHHRHHGPKPDHHHGPKHEHHHGPRHDHHHGSRHGAVHKEMLSTADFKCMKIERKLQKLQSKTQKMSLELDDVPETSQYKHKGERKLGRLSRKMEQLESKRCHIMAKKVSRTVLEPREEPTASAPVSMEPQIMPMESSNNSSIENERPARKYDAAILTENKPVLERKLDNGSIFSYQWVVRNVGELPWDDKTEIRLAHASAGMSLSEHTIPAPKLQPGDWDKIVISFEVPARPGLYECYFHFFQNEDRFGQVLRCSFSIDPIQEIQEANLAGSVIQEKDKGEYESDLDEEDDDDDDSSSDSSDSDFVHVDVPMPQCYQYQKDKDDDKVEKESNPSLPGEEASALSTVLIPSLRPELSLNPTDQSCKTPPTTPREAESEADEPTSDTTLIKYPMHELKDMENRPVFPKHSQRVDDAERESSPVHILPETLVTGAMNVAAKAYSSAEAIMRSLQGSTLSSSTAFSAAHGAAFLGPEPSPRTAPVPTPRAVSEEPTDPRTQNLITLADMGFFDDRLNEQLLDRYKENLQEVVAELILRQGRSAR
ncbi:uncharacterized protein LOC132197579 isoform X2 [Neocloeon triangulifer]|uniref:uncharacterized protein LOC132197579 isoform X2 n=1 Tax=Neocloeon triangulifer TaxID=2078957 RepID=UPI00286F295B|nr:uncharacterized protein LOC132197579 isoform X2 [Neocloeon triangulifer]